MRGGVHWSLPPFDHLCARQLADKTLLFAPQDMHDFHSVVIYTTEAHPIYYNATSHTSEMNNSPYFGDEREGRDSKYEQAFNYEERFVQIHTRPLTHPLVFFYVCKWLRWLCLFCADFTYAYAMFVLHFAVDLRLHGPRVISYQKALWCLSTPWANWPKRIIRFGARMDLPQTQGICFASGTVALLKPKGGSAWGI
jgi:hypothetical protein